MGKRYILLLVNSKMLSLRLFCVTTAGQKKGEGKLMHIVYLLAIETNISIQDESSKYHCLKKYLHI